VTDPELRDFFVACAGVAGALIGLLFVAISIEHERLTAEDADQVQRIRASAALTAFSNALAISLFGLIPGVGLGWTALIVSGLGLAFVAGSLLSLLRVRRSRPVARWDTVFIVGLIVTFGLQLSFGIRLIAHPGQVGASRGVAILVVVCFFIGIARAWELIGGPQVGLGHELATAVRAHGSAREPDGSDEY